MKRVGTYFELDTSQLFVGLHVPVEKRSNRTRAEVHNG